MYDSIADWYEERVAADSHGVHSAAGELLLSLLPPPSGSLLDAGCGGGVYLPSLVERGWHVTGLDLSEEQLRVARRRVGETAQLVRGDVRRLPFAGGSFDAAVATFLHTDVDDLDAAFTELARVLRSGGRFVYVGAHPCFVNPYAEGDGDRLVLHPGYRTAGWTRTGPGIGAGVRSRVGVHHRPLAEFLNAVCAGGLAIREVVEAGGEAYPLLLGIAAEATR